MGHGYGHDRIEFISTAGAKGSGVDVSDDAAAAGGGGSGGTGYYYS